MRFSPAEPDIATIHRRIMEGDIDLQPDFQRGEVWAVTKKQRLIDTVLRGWVIPPVLIISPAIGGQQQVLDGQQRLASMRDFLNNEFPVDGHVAPVDENIKILHGKYFWELPDDLRRAILRTPVRMYEIYDYKPEEPAEIFFRLNQPTGLTSAEKRNAFFGPVRDQIRVLVEEFEKNENNLKKSLGFSNSRMAYDDVFARLAFVLESKSLRKKITSTSVNDMYRRSKPIDDKTLLIMKNAVAMSTSVFQIAGGESKGGIGRLNKATLLSWLIFFSKFSQVGGFREAAEYFSWFESCRSYVDMGLDLEDNSPKLMSTLAAIYSDRSSSRVIDVSSVLLRDFSLWMGWCLYSEKIPLWMTRWEEKIEYFLVYMEEPGLSYEGQVLDFLENINWGREI